MSTPQIHGSCLCAAVKFEISQPYTAFRYCHCSRCRKASGSAHAANVFVPEAQFSWKSGENLVHHYKVPDAKTFAVSFCTRCGSRVPHHIAVRSEYLVPAGVLDADPGARPENAIYWGSRAPWYVEPDKMPRFDERP